THIAVRRLGPVGHRDGGFDPEVLNDYFLDVAIALVQVADGEQRIDAVLGRFANADQQAGSEGDIPFARFFNGTEAPGGQLVWSVIVGCTGGEQRGVCGFEHESHAWRDLCEPGDPLSTK